MLYCNCYFGNNSNIAIAFIDKGGQNKMTIDELRAEIKYNGCNNCKYQPGPSMACDWLKEQTEVFFICPRWELKEDKTK